MLNFELTYLINPELTDEKAGEIAKLFSQTMIDGGGLLIKEELPKKISLHYLIKKQDRAFLAVLFFQAEPALAIKIRELVEKQKDILRFIIVKKRLVEEKPIERSEGSREALPFEEEAEGELAEKAKKPATKAKKMTIERRAPESKKEKESKKVDMAEIEKELEEIL